MRQIFVTRQNYAELRFFCLTNIVNGVKSIESHRYVISIRGESSHMSTHTVSALGNNN